VTVSDFVVWHILPRNLTSQWAHAVRETTNKFCMVIKLDMRKIITVLTTNTDA